MIKRNGDIYLIEGTITLDNVLAVLAAGDRLFKEPEVVVDFSEATEVDSSALSLMLEWTRRARARGAKITFANLGESISSLIKLYGVEALVPAAAK